MAVRSALPDRDPDAGDTLVEVLVTVVLIGIVASALIGALMTATRTSTIHRSIANTESLAKTFLERAEYQLETGGRFSECATPATYTNAYLDWPATPPGYTGYTVSVTTVKYWNGTSGTWDTGSCSSTPADQTGIQMIAVTAVAPDGGSSGIETAVYNSAFKASYQSCYATGVC